MMENNERNIFITGPPRSGKSTLVEEVIDELDVKAEGLRTPDIRKEGQRRGFKLLDIKSGDEGILSHVDLEEGPSVSKYRVNIDDLERFTRRSLRNHSDRCDVLIIDEIGTMELFSPTFKETVEEVLESEMLVLAVLHRNYVSEYGEEGSVLDLGESDYEEVKEELKKHIKKVYQESSE